MHRQIHLIIGIILLGRLMIKSKFWEQLPAPSSQNKDQGFSNTQGWENLKGEIAIADTDLHPSGWINIKDRRIFVLTEGGFIEKGKEVNAGDVIARLPKETTKTKDKFNYACSTNGFTWFHCFCNHYFILFCSSWNVDTRNCLTRDW